MIVSRWNSRSAAFCELFWFDGHLIYFYIEERWQTSPLRQLRWDVRLSWCCAISLQHLSRVNTILGYYSTMFIIYTSGKILMSGPHSWLRPWPHCAASAESTAPRQNKSYFKDLLWVWIECEWQFFLFSYNVQSKQFHEQMKLTRSF